MDPSVAAPSSAASAGPSTNTTSQAPTMPEPYPWMSNLLEEVLNIHSTALARPVNRYLGRFTDNKKFIKRLITLTMQKKYSEVDKLVFLQCTHNFNKLYQQVEEQRAELGLDLVVVLRVLHHVLRGLYYLVCYNNDSITRAPAFFPYKPERSFYGGVDNWADSVGFDDKFKPGGRWLHNRALEYAMAEVELQVWELWKGVAEAGGEGEGGGVQASGASLGVEGQHGAKQEEEQPVGGQQGLQQQPAEEGGGGGDESDSEDEWPALHRIFG